MKLTVNETQRLAETSNPLLAYVLHELQTYLVDELGEDFSDIVLEIPADLLNPTTT